jgi:hypothetical protein
MNSSEGGINPLPSKFITQWNLSLSNMGPRIVQSRVLGDREDSMAKLPGIKIQFQVKNEKKI